MKSVINSSLPPAYSDDYICSWVGKHIGMVGHQLMPCVTLQFLKKGNLEAAVIFNNYRPDARDIYLTIAADTPSWISKGRLNQIFSYVFEQLNCNRLSLMIRRKNKRARKLAEGLGFKYEGNKRKGYDGIDDGIEYGMLKSECRWIGDRYGQKHAVTT